MRKVLAHVARQRDTSYRKILGELAASLDGLRFSDLFKRTGLSTEPLTERLDLLLKEGSINKLGGRYGRYHITSRGVEKLSKLEELPTVRADRLRPETVQLRPSQAEDIVWSGSASVVNLRKKLVDEERSRLEGMATRSKSGIALTIPREVLEKSGGGRIVFGWQKKKQ